MATPLGTLDRTPPPFFRQGPSALTKLTYAFVKDGPADEQETRAIRLG